jgi:hypothetical protein
MVRKLRWKLALVALLCTIVCAPVFWKIGTVIYDAHRLAKWSGQMALLQEASQKLDAYHKMHGEYPASLDSFEFTYPDGGDASMLADFRYLSDGKTYTLKAQSLYDESEEMEVGSKTNGEIIRH